MGRSHDFLIVGARVYGVTAALELRRRGHRVALLDPGPVPHPLAASTDMAAGGSGHAFEMAPILGGLIADAALGEANRWLPKFRWREVTTATAGQEAARCHG